MVTASCLPFSVPLNGRWKSHTQSCLGWQNNPMKTGVTVGDAGLASSIPRSQLIHRVFALAPTLPPRALALTRALYTANGQLPGLSVQIQLASL